MYDSFGGLALPLSMLQATIFQLSSTVLNTGNLTTLLLARRSLRSFLAIVNLPHVRQVLTGVGSRNAPASNHMHPETRTHARTHDSSHDPKTVVIVHL